MQPDWEAELSRAAREAATGPEGPARRRFGYPDRARAPPATPEFGWDRSRTHRVESIPEGGLLVHLNDRCILVLAPLPMAFCSPTTPAADGGLFDGMAASRGAPSVDRIP